MFENNPRELISNLMGQIGERQALNFLLDHLIIY
jgi:hypothetical protein